MIFKTLIFDTLDSTNDTAKDLPVGMVVIAKKQTAGRGRMGRHWHSLPGNLFLSAVVPDFGSQTPLMSFVASLAVAKAIEEFHPKLKWPNDVLIQGKKVCGILLEQGTNGLVIGIGLNIATAPDSTKSLYPTTSLNNKITAFEASKRILDQLNILINSIQNNDFSNILELWKTYAFGLGEKITVHLPHQTIEGTFSSLDSTGRLCLQLSDGQIQYVSAGDVFFNEYKKGKNI